jgi:hypothetical protein
VEAEGLVEATLKKYLDEVEIFTDQRDCISTY